MFVLGGVTEERLGLGTSAYQVVVTHTSGYFVADPGDGLLGWVFVDAENLNKRRYSTKNQNMKIDIIDILIDIW